MTTYKNLCLLACTLSFCTGTEQDTTQKKPALSDLAAETSQLAIRGLPSPNTGRDGLSRRLRKRREDMEEVFHSKHHKTQTYYAVNGFSTELVRVHENLFSIELFIANNQGQYFSLDLKSDAVFSQDEARSERLSLQTVINNIQIGAICSQQSAFPINFEVAKTPTEAELEEFILSGNIGKWLVPTEQKIG